MRPQQLQGSLGPGAACLLRSTPALEAPGRAAPVREAGAAVSGSFWAIERPINFDTGYGVHDETYQLQ